MCQVDVQWTIACDIRLGRSPVGDSSLLLIQHGQGLVGVIFPVFLLNLRDPAAEGVLVLRVGDLLNTDLRNSPNIHCYEVPLRRVFSQRILSLI